MSNTANERLMRLFSSYQLSAALAYFSFRATLASMPPRKKKAAEPQASGHRCHWAHCEMAGDYKAPKSRALTNEYQWFCLEHVREFNKNWNYFEGMNETQIYAFQRDATMGHRPTWKSDLSPQELGGKLEDAVHRFFAGDPRKIAAAIQPISTEDKKALALLDLNHPTHKEEIKAQFRLMAKKYHPDMNKGDKNAEDMFKRITIAYNYLIEHYIDS